MLHHIVEQNQIRKRAKFPAEMVHNSKNVTPIPTCVNRELNAYYAKKQDYTDGMSVRDWLTDKSFEFQYEFSIKIMLELLGNYHKRGCP